MLFDSFPSVAEDHAGVAFSEEAVSFQLDNEVKIIEWLHTLVEQEQQELHSLHYIFCSDEYLHQLNVEYLDHDTLTDVITFHYAELPTVEGDIYISIDRVKENAKKFDVDFDRELARVMAHGVLHLCGYGDKTAEEITVMRQKENEALDLLFAIGKTNDTAS